MNSVKGDSKCIHPYVTNLLGQSLNLNQSALSQVKLRKLISASHTAEVIQLIFELYVCAASLLSLVRSHGLGSKVHTSDFSSSFRIATCGRYMLCYDIDWDAPCGTAFFYKQIWFRRLLGGFRHLQRKCGIEVRCATARR